MTLLLEICFALLLASPPQNHVLPGGTEFDVRLQTGVSTAGSKPGDPVEAVVISPAISGERVLIPAGAVVSGIIAEVQKIDEAHPRAALKLEFNTLSASSGPDVGIAALVTDVDNARETVADDGLIVGILPEETLSSRMDQGLERLSTRMSGLASILMTAKRSMVAESDPLIDYQPGVELRLRLTRDARLENASATLQDLPIRPIDDYEALATLVNSLPYQTMADNGTKPSDITNLMFLGSREQIESAFAEAGWSAAAELDREAKIETARAVMENRGYAEAPVSLLMLADREPDLVFQKQNNTFAKRHHLRIWRQPSSFLGREIWVSSATHDIGIEFSPENMTFIHRINPNIDAERAKVVTDLLFTGTVEGLHLVVRNNVPQNSKNATGDDLLTDGSMAVLLFADR